MSGRNKFKSSMVVGAGVVALTLGACASSGTAGSRYGSIYDYESGGSGCVAGACGAVVAPHVDTAYAPSHTSTVIGGQAVSPGVIYTDCSQTGSVGCLAPAPIYTQPTPHPIQTHTATTSQAGPINCPTGTTPAGDGTCMITGGGSTYSGITHSGITRSGITHGATHTTTTTSGALHCPSGTSRSHDGTCMVSTPTVVHPPAPHTGYQPAPHHQAPVYRPIRK